MFSKFFSPKILQFFFLDNVGKYGTAIQATDATIRRQVRIACWWSKATNTHSKYVILTAFPLQQWLHGRASVYIACLDSPK